MKGGFKISSLPIRLADRIGQRIFKMFLLELKVGSWDKAINLGREVQKQTSITSTGDEGVYVCVCGGGSTSGILLYISLRMRLRDWIWSK